ncbi:DNA-3-methyladenine glycosylase family protein [Propionibacteriaceae bacterium Y1700]|uniref:DNA-3-methyladenine glycosylase family protein n=1 Tax=Microlunatus sp. Y1700 TaxID=3418487 RepID=UPI003DA719FE
MTSTVDVAINGVLCTESVHGLVANHAVPGLERFDPATGTYARLIMDGSVIVVQIGSERVTVTADASVINTATERVSAWLDLTTDTSVFEQAWIDDPILGPLVAARPGMRVVKQWDPYEAMITTVLGQQVSLAAGRLFAGRLVAAYGIPGPDGLALFPTAERLAAVDVEELRATVGLTGARSRTIHAVARAWAEGLRLDGDPETVRRRLLALSGIGPWTVDQLSVRVLGDPDAFSAGDLVLRRALGGVSAAEAEQIAERWRPWRAYALLHLWTEAAYR